MKRSLADLETALTDARAAIEKAQDKAGKLETAIARHPDYLARKLRLALPPYLHKRFIDDGLVGHGRLLNLEITTDQIKLVFAKEVVAFYEGSHPGIDYGVERSVDEQAWDDTMRRNKQDACVALVVLIYRAYNRLNEWTDDMLGIVHNLHEVRDALFAGADVSQAELQRALRIAYAGARDVVVDAALLELAREKKALPSQQEILLLQRPVKKGRMN